MAMGIRKVAALFGGLVFLSAWVYGQSLGDVARTQRQNLNQKPASAAHKVITDEDISSHEEDSKTAKGTTDKSVDGDHNAPINTASNGEELKAKCLEAKQAIKDYQHQIDQLRASSQLVEANRYSNGVQYNQQQLRKQQEADRMEKQLEIAKKKFTDLQEQARKAGFGSAVYDP